MECNLKKQGFKPGSCATFIKGEAKAACKVTLKWEGDTPYRLIKSAHLSRPEHYFSIYQSGCNLSCLKCHSWEFTQHAQGEWLSPKDIVHLAEEYASQVTYWEPKERMTAFHALDLCRSCGTCLSLSFIPLFIGGKIVERMITKPSGRRSPLCPNKLSPEQLVLSPQGFGPARNIISFTGGDIMCQPHFYAHSAEGIKSLGKNLWVLLETNGYGLTPLNLDIYKASGVDAFWLDIKALNPEIHKRLTGVENEEILKLPEEILKRGFTLEVLSLFIPGWVEVDQIREITRLLSSIDPNIPFTILAFFPEYKLKAVPPPTLEQMLLAYEAAREEGLKQVRLGNPSVFLKGEEEFRKLLAAAPGAI